MVAFFPEQLRPSIIKLPFFYHSRLFSAHFSLGRKVTYGLYDVIQSPLLWIFAPKLKALEIRAIFYKTFGRFSMVLSGNSQTNISDFYRKVLLCAIARRENFIALSHFCGKNWAAPNAHFEFKAIFGPNMNIQFWFKSQFWRLWSW